MKNVPLLLAITVLMLLAVVCYGAPMANNVGFTVNGKSADISSPIDSDSWFTLTAKYRYSGDMKDLTNTYIVICRGSSQLSGFYIGYNTPRNELAIVKHGVWNDTEATGAPGVQSVIENDQGYMDCGATTVKIKDDTITVNYRLKMKKGVMKGMYNVFMYIEDKDLNYDAFQNMGSIMIDRDSSAYRTDMPKQWKSALKPQGKAVTLALAAAGKTTYTIVVPKNPIEVHNKAASELARYLGLISDAKFPIVTEDKTAGKPGPFISLGRTNMLAKSKATWQKTGLKSEGYAVEAIGKNLFIYSNTPRGLMNGVFSLLEEDLGCRWYAVNTLDTPKHKDFKAAIVSRNYVPVLELRDPFIYKMHDPNWSLYNKTNTPHARIPMAWGGSLRYQHMGHTYSLYFPTQTYFPEHPEYFSLVNGKRQPSQLCHTNEDVIRLSIEKTCKIFRDNPEVTITAIGPNDGRGFCDCENCKKLDDANGGRSGSFFYFVNRIAEGVKKEFPNNHLISLAYLDYAMPPTNLEVDPYIIIQLCSDSHAWKYQFLYVWETEEYQKMVKAWAERKAKIYLWDYTTDYVHYLVPMANWQVVAGNTRFNIENGVKGIMYESESNYNDELRGWVWAKQLWNPNLEVKDLIKDFIFGYYKEAADPLWDFEMMMWDFWEKWHKAPHAPGVDTDNPLLNNLQCSYAPDGPMFTVEFMDRMREDFNQAEKLAKTDLIRDRVSKAKISLLYLELSQNIGYYSEFGDFVYGKSIRKPQAEKEIYAQYLQEFVSLCKKHEQANFGIPITLDKISTKWQACIDADSSTLSKMDMPAEWIFTTDPDDKGVAEKWYADQKYFDAAVRNSNEFGGGEVSIAPLEKGLQRLHINRGVGWEQQGFEGYDGYGWYFQNIEVPEEIMSKPHVYVYFMRVNEEAWVYVNGQPAFERTYQSTGQSVGDLIGVPVTGDIKSLLKPGQRNTIAVRVLHSSGLGGILFPATLMGTDIPATAAELDKYRY